MNETDIKTKLNKLADYRAQLDAIALMRQEAIDTILTPELKAEISAVHAEFDDKTSAVTLYSAALEIEIKQAVIYYGESVKGKFLQAVYNKPRVSWDGKGLAGYAVAHPEVNAFMTVGEPSVTLRGVK